MNSHLLLSRRQFTRSLACGLAGACLPLTRQCKAASIEDGLQSAVRFLTQVQSRDGAWRSDVRGVFRDGDALTPLVLRVLNELPAALRPRNAIDRGLAWMNQLARNLRADSDSWSSLRYPLFTACHAARLGKAIESHDVWIGILKKLQISNALGWPDSDPRSGGWSDASAPMIFTASKELADMCNPNLSGTVSALEALTGDAHRDVRNHALAFVESCQNFRAGAAPDDELDDGGFFFTHDDPIRNKAGVSREHPIRFHSYGSTTCDGLLSLVACDLPPDHPRIAAAVAWLQRHSGEMPHPGKWPAARRAGAAGLDFYFAQTYADTLRCIDRSMPSHHDWSREQQKRLSAVLLARQGQHGSWSNSEPESFEDEPLLATAFCLRALMPDNRD